MPTRLDPELLIAADPARDRDPSASDRARSRARLDALLAADTAPSRASRSRARPLAAGAFVVAAVAAVAAVVIGVGASGGMSPAEAFAARLEGDGIAHIVFARQRTHEPGHDGVNPVQDELWISLADGSWRLRSRLHGHYLDQRFDGRRLTSYSSRTGKTRTDTPADPSRLVGRPLVGVLSPSIQPLRDVDAGRLKVAGTTTIDGERVYDLVPTAGVLPEGLEMHWYVTEDGELRRMSTGDGSSSLTTDVETYEVLEPTAANRALLR
jgi:hypothetical protein